MDFEQKIRTRHLFPCGRRGPEFGSATGGPAPAPPRHGEPHAPSVAPALTFSKKSFILDWTLVWDPLLWGHVSNDPGARPGGQRAGSGVDSPVADRSSRLEPMAFVAGVGGPLGVAQ